MAMSRVAGFCPRHRQNRLRSEAMDRRQVVAGFFVVVGNSHGYQLPASVAWEAEAGRAGDGPGKGER